MLKNKSLALLLLALSVTDGFADNVDVVAQAKTVNRQLKEVVEIYFRFTEEIQSAAGTPRFLLQQHLLDLVKRRNQLDDVKTTGCAATVKDSALKTMNFGIEGFERFANQSNLSDEASFSLFKAYKDRTRRELEECLEQLEQILK